jgi:sugar lactone lactonase YvrE
MPEPQILLTGLSIGESPRWHEDRLWFSNWGAQEIVVVDLEGNSEVMARVPMTGPFCIDWLPDGRLLVVAGQEAQLLRGNTDGSLSTHAELGSISERPWNDIVVDGRGYAYVGNIGFDFPEGDVAPGIVAQVSPDGICLDAEGAVWYGVVPNERCVRVREGSVVLQTVELDRGCFACMLGGEDGKTLFMVAADVTSEAPTGQVLTVGAPAADVGWP